MINKLANIRIAVILIALFIQSCDQQQELDTVNPNDADALMLNDIDNYFLSLSKWQDISKPVPDDPGTAKGDPKKKQEGKYECIDQDFSLATTPSAIVIFDSTSATLWPGSVLQGGPYLNGHFEQLPIAQQAPIALTINLSIPESSVNVDKPSKQEMQAAVATLVARGKDIPIPADASYRSTEAYSRQQLLLDFNLSAKYMNQNAKAALKIDSSVETRSISAYFVQNMFTVSVPTPSTPSRYFSDISMEDIEDQKALGRIGKNNPPLYVESVTYGRVLLFTMTSTASKTDVQAALDYAYRGGADIDVKTKAHYESILSSAEVNVVPYGGPWKEAAQLIRSANIKDYFSDAAPPLTTAVPISYKLNTLARGVTASVAETTTYTQRDCHSKDVPVVKKNGKFSLQYVGGGDNRYLSVAEWRAIGLAGDWPYPTLQLKHVTLQFRGSADALTNGSNIRFATLEGKAGGRKLGISTELGAWSAKKYVFYDKPDSSSKQNWIITKKCSGKCGDEYIRYGDHVNIRSQYKPDQYLCNDSDRNTRHLITKKAACTWQINP